MTDETPQIDPRNNPESQMKEEGVNLPGGSTAGDGGVVMSDAPTADAGRDGVVGDRVTGTDEGGLLAGVTRSDDDED